MYVFALIALPEIIPLNKFEIVVASWLIFEGKRKHVLPETFPLHFKIKQPTSTRRRSLIRKQIHSRFVNQKEDRCILSHLIGHMNMLQNLFNKRSFYLPVLSPFPLD